MALNVGQTVYAGELDTRFRAPAFPAAARPAEADAAQHADAEIVTAERDPDGLDADGVERERQARLARWHRQPTWGNLDGLGGPAVTQGRAFLVGCEHGWPTPPGHLECRFAGRLSWIAAAWRSGSASGS